MTLPLDSLVAIDVHVHALRAPGGSPEESGLAADRAVRYQAGSTPTCDETAAYYRERRMACVMFTLDSEAGTGEPRLANMAVIEAARRHPDVIIPFASIDPWRGRAAVAEARELVQAGEVAGFKFHPTLQAFFPHEHWVYPLYEVIAEAGLPAVFHSGQTGMGRTLPGGGGVRLKYSNPMFLDDVAVDFPTMDVVIAHPSFPWQAEALAVAHHKQNVWIDLSGWSPKYFDPQLVHYANTLLRDKVLFGSDYPVLTPDAWLDAFAAAPFRDEVRPGILKNNAVRLLGLARS